MKNYFAEILNGAQYVAVVAQTDNVLQIVQLVLACVSSVVIIAFKLWAWYKEAKKDGKVTADEIKDGAKILEDGAKDLNDKIEGK